MKLNITLTSLIILLFFNKAYAISEDAHACNKAFDQGDYKSASEFAEKALKASTSDREAYICKGRIQSDIGNLPLALEAFTFAEKLSKDTLDKAVVALITGHAYRNAKDYPSAINNYEACYSQIKPETSHSQDWLILILVMSILTLKPTNWHLKHTRLQTN